MAPGRGLVNQLDGEGECHVADRYPAEVAGAEGAGEDLEIHCGELEVGGERRLEMGEVQRGGMAGEVAGLLRGWNRHLEVLLRLLWQERLASV